MLGRLKGIVEARFPRLFSVLADIRDRRALIDGEPEMRLLSSLVAAGDVVCDIGANRGIYTFWLLRYGARVIAFEPNPHLVEVMKLRFAAAVRDGRLRLVGCALSDGDGDVVLHVPVGSAALATIEAAAIGQLHTAIETISVPRRRLDDCVAEDVAFIKIDVEGHEDRVLGGGMNLVSRCKPSLLIEAEERHRPGAVTALRNRLEPLGYEGFFLDGDMLRPVSAFEPGRDQDPGALNEAGTHRREGRSYLNNFIFVARPEVKARLMKGRREAPE